MKTAIQSVSLAFLAVIATLVQAADEAPYVPAPMVNTFWVYAFFVLFVGVCVWIGVAIWRAERRSKQAARDAA